MPRNRKESSSNKEQPPLQALQKTAHDDKLSKGPPGAKEEHTAGSEMGRKQALFLQAWELTCGNVSAACKMAGISRTAYYRWLASHSQQCRQFRLDLAELRPAERLKDAAESVIMHHLERNDLKAAMFVLKERGGERGWNGSQASAKPEEPVDQLGEDMKPLLDKINQRARSADMTFPQAVAEFLDVFRYTIKPEVTERLEAMG